MTKAKLAERILQQTEGNPFVSISELMRIFHLGYRRVDELVEDLIPVTGKGRGMQNGRGKWFFVDDIADAIMRKGI